MSPANHPAVQAAVQRARSLTHHEHRSTVTSTNDVALAEVAAGAALGLVITADRQTAGRGRHGRSWTDDVAGPEGPGNLAVSIVVALPTRAPGMTPLAAGLAVHRAYTSAGAAPVLKWPNDVLLDGCKAAGILVERHTVSRRDVAVIGCGLDLDWRGVARTEEAVGWTSLAESLGHGVDRGQVLGDLLAGLDAELSALEEPVGLLARYRHRCGTLGSEVEVTLPGGGRLVGTAVDLDGEGLLVVDTGRERVTVRAGDVVAPPAG